MLPGVASANPAKKVPYWASISADEARMRVGPSLDYPSNWIYRRRDLPVKVVQTLGNWRKIEDSDGTQGWMHVRLLSDTQTAIVTGGVSPLRKAPNEAADILFRVQPGVVGRLSDCRDGWCRFDTHGQRGFVQTKALWGGAK
jgi:SH3-like domain-containing protein